MRFSFFVVAVAPFIALAACAPGEIADTGDGSANDGGAGDVYVEDVRHDTPGCFDCSPTCPPGATNPGFGSSCAADQCTVSKYCGCICCAPKSSTLCGGAPPRDGGLTQHAKIILVHAAPYAPDFRICFGVGAKNDGSDVAIGPLPPLPHDDTNLPLEKTYPALYAGSGGALPDLTNLETKAITPFLIPVPNTKLANDVKSNVNERTCDTLIGTTGQGGTSTNTLVRNTDFFQLATVPTGTFKQGNTFIIGFTGCVRGNTSSTAMQECGATYDVTSGNLVMKLVQLDRVVTDPTKIGLQVLHLARAIDGYVSASPGFTGGMKNFVGIALDNNGLPPNAPVGDAINYGAFVPPVAASDTYSASQYAHSVAYDRIVGYTLMPDAAPAETTVGTAAFPFAVVQRLTYGSVDAGNGIGPAGQPLYLPGANYTLVLVGDPTAEQLVDDGGANPRYDGHGIHVLMFPNDPPLPKL